MVISFFSNCTLFMILFGDEDILKFIKNRIRVFREIHVIPSWIGQNNNTVHPANQGIDDSGSMELNVTPSVMQTKSRLNADGENQTRQIVKHIYVIPVSD